MTAHWGMPDPAAVTGTEAEIAFAFADAYRMLNTRISIFVSLPMRSLDQLSLQKRLDEIGKTQHGATLRRRPPDERSPFASAAPLCSPKALGTAILVATVVGSGIMADKLPAETRRSRCSATPSRPARSWWC